MSASAAAPPSSLLHNRRRYTPLSTVCSSSSPNQPRRESSTNGGATRRRAIATIVLTTVATVGIESAAGKSALAESWGTRSFIREKYFQPGLSPEEATERIKQTAEGLRSMREMLDHMSWQYVIFYIRLKQSYLSQDLKTVMNILPESRRKEYIKTANELVDNMAELDVYVRTPKVYESYLYYEKTLKSMDDVVAFLA